MWTPFKCGENAKTIEYRDVYIYTNEDILSQHQSEIKYEENATVLEKADEANAYKE